MKTSGQGKTPYWPTDARLSDKKQYITFERREKYFIVLRLPDDTTADAEVSKKVWETSVEGHKVQVAKQGISGKYIIITRN